MTGLEYNILQAFFILLLKRYVYTTLRRRRAQGIRHRFVHRIGIQ